MKWIFLGFLPVASVSCAGSGLPMAPQQSPHFDAVSQELQLGGTVYAYADIDGDAQRAADFLLTLLRDMPAMTRPSEAHRLNATSIVRVLGLDEVKAFGLSSYESGELFHNRSFIHHAGTREGLLRLFDGEPAGFEIVDIAPKHADLVWEQWVDVAALVEVVRSLGELGVGIAPEELDRALGDRVLDLDVTVGSLVEELTTSAGLILAIDESRNLRIPGASFTFPYTDFLFRIDGLERLADAIIRRAASDPLIRAKHAAGWVIVSPAIRLPPPWNTYEPSVVKEIATGRLYVVSSPSFLKQCLETGEGVQKTPGFMRAFDQLSGSGNAVLYLSPRMTRQMHAALDQVIEANGQTVPNLIARFLMPDVGYPVGWVVENKPNGILFTSNTPSSHKSTLLTLGLAAALPAAVVLGASLLAPRPSAPALN